MFQSNRFTSIVTRDTRERLERARSNDAPISRGDRHRGANVAIQQALSDLNRGYLYPAEVDGYFGSRTEEAVESFQRDYGLIADGIVGQQVLEQLDSLYAPSVTRKPHGVSVHIGVDRVDPAHYGGPLTLPSCENDAKAMRDIAQSLGYDTLTLINEDATTANFNGFMRSSINSLFAGDTLFITFSGHGSQIANTAIDAEDDNLDETLVFYDRMLIDDELYSLLGELRVGVRVHVVFDSCHSGTALKSLMVPPGEQLDLEKQKYREDVEAVMTKSLATTGEPLDNGGREAFIPIRRDAISKALEGGRPEFAEAPKLKEERVKDLSELFTDLYAETNFGQAKFIGGGQIYYKNQPLYDAVKNVVGSKESRELACNVVTLSAARDSQTTPAGNPLSLFTFNLTQVWRNGNFSGSYQQFQRSVVNRSRPDATPQINVYGAPGVDARRRERPWTF